MAIEQLPMLPAFYDKQRFQQFGSQDCANWYMVSGLATKAQYALYPAMGRKHVRVLNNNKLEFEFEPRAIFRSIDYVYVFVGLTMIQVDRFFNTRTFTNADFNEINGPIWFDYLPVGNLLYVMFTAPSSIDGRQTFVFEETSSTPAIVRITDVNAPPNPMYVAAFANRFVVSVSESPQFFLSRVGLSNIAGTGFSASEAFSFGSVSPYAPEFASASGKIQQFAVLHSQLFIFSDFVTDIWANVPSSISGAVFPLKFNTSNNFDYGMADPFSLDVDFGMMTWLGKNRNGLVTFMVSTGQNPTVISTQAINVLLEKAVFHNGLSPFLEASSEGFLYQWENSIFYRVSAGAFFDFSELDIESAANAIEYNFDTKTWHRVIELNGERNRIRKHVFFNNRHLVTVIGETTVYEMRGDIYYNENRNVEQTDVQADDAYSKFPMRYEMVTRQIFEPDYSEFITDYVEIDFVFGDQTFYQNCAPFSNTVYLVTEESTPEVPIYLVTEDSEPGSETFVVQDGTNTPSFDDNHYCALFKPHIELYWSDDGGMIFNSADLREFSPLGQYRWKMRWYSLGASRNRVYKLVCVSSAPIVVMGAVMNKRRASGGAN